MNKIARTLWTVSLCADFYPVHLFTSISTAKDLVPAMEKTGVYKIA